MIKPVVIKNKPKKKPVTPLPQTLQRRRTSILPTRYGMLFIFLLSGMLIGSINYNNNLGFLLTFLLGSMALVSLGHTAKNLAGIRIITSRSHSVYAGDTARFEFLVRAAHSVRPAVGFKFENSEEVVQDISHDSDHWISVPVIASTRGVLKPGPLNVTTRYPLGLFVARSRLYLDMACIVYPKPIAVPFKFAKGLRFNHDKGKKTDPGIDDDW